MPKAKAKNSKSEAKTTDMEPNAKDTVNWPWGSSSQGRGLKDSISVNFWSLVFLQTDINTHNDRPE